MNNKESSGGKFFCPYCTQLKDGDFRFFYLMTVCLECYEKLKVPEWKDKGTKPNDNE